MVAKALEALVETLVTDDLSAMGYELVRVQIMQGGRYMTLQVMAERRDEKPMTVDDCVRISHAVSEKLDADPALVNTYTLEISSPGIDRPLVSLKDFERFTGHLARVELAAPQDGKKRFQGRINRITGREPDAEIELGTDTGAVRVPMQRIERAKLVLTDELLSKSFGVKH